MAFSFIPKIESVTTRYTLRGLTGGAIKLGLLTAAGIIIKEAGPAFQQFLHNNLTNSAGSGFVAFGVDFTNIAYTAFGWAGPTVLTFNGYNRLSKIIDGKVGRDSHNISREQE